MGERRHNRCRLVIMGAPDENRRRGVDQISGALSGGDVAALILWPGDFGQIEFQKCCESVVPMARASDVAVIVAGDSRVAAVSGADGLHIEDKAELAEHLGRGSRFRIIGAGGAKNRHEALGLGELRPDYIFFGRFGYDTEPEPHPRNLTLGRWWAELVEIPCIVMAGSTIDSLNAVAAGGAEFAAASAAIFTGRLGPDEAVRRANRLLDENAPDLKAPT